MKPVFIDIGAYDGQELKWALAADYEVHSFEPNQEMRPKLEPYLGQATIHFKAAWNEDGEKPFYRRAADEIDNENKDQGRTLIQEKTNINKAEYDLVETVNIGKYLRELDKDIDFLKIDTEGGKYIIIESILNEFDYKRIKHWYVEDHEAWIPDQAWRDHKDRVMKRITEYGINIKDWNLYGKK